MLFFLIRLEELVMPFALIDNSCIGFIPCWGQKKNSLRSHLQENDQKCRQGRNSSEEEIGGQIFDLLVELLLSCEGLKEGGRDSKDYLLGSNQLSGSFKFRFWHELQFSQSLRNVSPRTVGAKISNDGKKCIAKNYLED